MRRVPGSGLDHVRFITRLITSSISNLPLAGLFGHETAQAFRHLRREFLDNVLEALVFKLTGG